MRLLLLLALLAVAVPSLQQTTNSTKTTNTSTATSTTSPTTIASTECCSARCPRVYRPVCAHYNGGRRTYANICVMQAARRCARRRREQGSCSSRGRRRREAYDKTWPQHLTNSSSVSGQVKLVDGMC